ncbi:hypothetical protein ACFSUS_21415 [Spirosoma soli]|uniref:Nitrogen fixation protein n=1 Tax=Spirosoma soli TaxID=1770529 RepID=A0ABW5MAW5_9BACT
MASLLCPSSIAKPGADLFGVVDDTGHVEYLEQPVTVDETFVDAARQGRAPEERFRFASNCIKKGCMQWDANSAGCGLVGKIVEVMNQKAEQALPACPIRQRCRWYHQQGALACANCDEVVRNIRMEEHASV